MRRIRVQKERRPSERGRYDVLPLDPRDQDVVRAKVLARRTERSAGPASS